MQRLADHVLGRPLEEWVAERRAAGDSFRTISIALREQTNGELDITETSLRQWQTAHDAAQAGETL